MRLDLEVEPVPITVEWGHLEGLDRDRLDR